MRDSFLSSRMTVLLYSCPLSLSASLGDAQLVQQGFSGCLRDVRFKMTDSPSEEWKSLDWARAVKKVEAYENWEGCPSETVHGAHFLGHGRILWSYVKQCTLTLLHDKRCIKI